MRRLRIRAIRGLLGSGRLPVGGKLALATLVREHVLGCVVELGGWWMAGATGSCHGALSQCNTAAGLLSVCCGRGRVQGLWARASGGAENALGRVRCHKILARAARNVGCRRVRRWAGQAGGSEELLWAARGCEAAVVVEAAVVAEVGEVREAVE